MNIPKISIITPVYNNPEFLEEVVVSVQTQVFNDWEHIIIDDGSSNAETALTISKLLAKYPRLASYRIENGGPGAARNFGIEKANGEFIFPLDDDDKIHPNLLHEAAAILDSDSKVGVVTTWIQSFGRQKNLVKPLGGTVENFLISNNACGNSLFRKSVWQSAGKYDENRFIIGYEDWDFWIRCTSLGYSVHVIEKPYFLYRIKNNDQSLHKLAVVKHLKLFEYIVKKNIDIYSQNLLPTLIRFEEKVIDTRNYFNNRSITSRLKGFIKRSLKMLH